MRGLSRKHLTQCTILTEDDGFLGRGELPAYRLKSYCFDYSLSGFLVRLFKGEAVFQPWKTTSNRATTQLFWCDVL